MLQPDAHEGHLDDPSRRQSILSNIRFPEPTNHMLQTLSHDSNVVISQYSNDSNISIGFPTREYSGDHPVVIMNTDHTQHLSPPEVHHQHPHQLMVLCQLFKSILSFCFLGMLQA